MQDKLILYSTLIVAVILHEISHGVVALFYGDDTAKRAGRLTLNPIPHIDPVGSILLPLMAVFAGAPAFGWAKPVPVNPARMRNHRHAMLVVGLAGPTTNFVLMGFGAVVARHLLRGGDTGTVLTVATSFALVNLILGVFNMLPIPPLDGSSLVERVLPARHLQSWYKFRPYGFLVLFVGVFYLGIFQTIINPFENSLFHFIAR